MQGDPCAPGLRGAECPGNPQVCDGAVFYDALQCNGSTWITLAATQCGEGGIVDEGGIFDAGTIFEAGLE
jgi:hypothetical protein